MLSLMTLLTVTASNPCPSSDLGNQKRFPLIVGLKPDTIIQSFTGNLWPLTMRAL
jgi:hypothetical protein